MKELSIEEKAKRYDEALENARQLCAYPTTKPFISDLQDLFPELKESEGERIRKALISVLKSDFENDTTIHDISVGDIIAWLEKQGEKSQGKSILEIWKSMRLEVYQQASGNRHEPNYSDDNTKMFSLNDIDEIIEKMNEQKPINRVEPKFKVGDFIVNDYCGGKVVELTNDAYLLDTGQGMPFSYEHNIHPWTIQDAKDGDVLAGKIDGDSYVLIYKQIKDGWIETYGHYYDSVNRFCVPSQLFCRDVKGTFRPATKEQCDLLFQKIKEAGYEWDANKRKLIKL